MHHPHTDIPEFKIISGYFPGEFKANYASHLSNTAYNIADICRADPDLSLVSVLHDNVPFDFDLEAHDPFNFNLVECFYILMFSPNKDYYITKNGFSVDEINYHNKPVSHEIIVTLAKTAYYRDLTMTIRAKAEEAKSKNALARFFPVPQG